MLFGIYCEVQIETLRQINLKYVESYEELVQFLTDFHLIPESRRPSILAIDNLDCFLEQRNLHETTKKMRMHYILTLANDCRSFLNSQNTFSQNNLIISYRCQSSPD